jgi:hypothetical protein
MTPNHPVISEAPSHKLRGQWVRHKVTGSIGYISFVVKYHEYMERPSDVYVVWPPMSHNKRVASIKTYSGGAYRVKDLVRIKTPRKEAAKWFRG